MFEKIIIADTSCLITLANIDDLPLLKNIYAKITITPQVALEFGSQLPSAPNHKFPPIKTCLFLTLIVIFFMRSVTMQEKNASYN